MHSPTPKVRRGNLCKRAPVETIPRFHFTFEAKKGIRGNRFNVETCPSGIRGNLCLMGIRGNLCAPSGIRGNLCAKSQTWKPRCGFPRRPFGRIGFHVDPFGHPWKPTRKFNVETNLQRAHVETFPRMPYANYARSQLPQPHWRKKTCGGRTYFAAEA